MPTAGKKRCIVIGANGLVGRSLVRRLSGAGFDWTGTFNKRPEAGLVKMDITSPADVDSLFLKVRPDVVFHCANLAGGVDFCQSHLGEARAFHLDGAVRIGERCRASDAAMVFISTDYVFDGARPSYKEDDAPNPLNLYGRLKLEAEDWIRSHVKRHLVIRTTNVYGWDPLTVTPNYMMGLYRALKDRKRFNAPSYLWGSPTYACDLAEAMIELCSEDASGVFHAVGSSFVNRLEWAGSICAALGLDASLLNGVSNPPEGMIPRPLKSRLNTEKFTGKYGTVLHDLKGGLELVKKDREECAIRCSASS